MTPEDYRYCESLFQHKRFTSRPVQIGSVGFGGENPIRHQSMTTTDTMDTEGTVEQSIRMIDAGCELVRITAPSKRDAENLGPIKDELRARGYDTPLVADIHFTPNAAEIAAGIVEKVRVNPGNYADKKKFEEIDYTDESYAAELERIRKRFEPLVLLCKENGTAMRIGTNHGSLSDRILSRYGDTPLGMVESAMEFLRICRDLDYHDIVLSMKASNPQVMVQAYRLLVHYFYREGMNYPLHLGVTEAGEGEDGRIKSAVGIGTLLEDGLGDTIRVSLTEEPEAEIPVARRLAERYLKRGAAESIPSLDELPYNPFEYTRRHTAAVGNVGGKNVPVVVADFSDRDQITPATLFPVGYTYSVPLDKWNLADQACDYAFAGNHGVDFDLPGTLGIIQNAQYWEMKDRHYPLLTAEQYLSDHPRSTERNFVRAGLNDLFSEELILALRADATAILVLETHHDHGMAEQRRAFMELLRLNQEIPVVVRRAYRAVGAEDFQLFSATDFGALLIDGFGDGVWSEADAGVSAKTVNATMFGILQATRTRISKTEYISCPSCGRTLFDLQETTAMIRQRTDHLKGVKIGIMGCIVNGPGEMADADYGYVGTGPGKITLYKEKEVVKRNIPAEHALDELIELIREHGDWVEPAVAHY